MLTRRRLLTCSAVLLLPGVAPAGPEMRLSGLLQDGRPVGPDDLKGWLLVYFGYTRCPDVCPLGLQTMAEAVDALGPLGERITPVFVTVDPERDTPEVLKEYVAFFHPRLMAVSPTAEQLAATAKAWRVKYARVEQSEGRPYLMDHTASIFLSDPGGAIAGRFPHDLGGAGMANKIRSVFVARP